MIRFLIGAAIGAASAAYVIGLLLSSSREELTLACGCKSQAHPNTIQAIHGNHPEITIAPSWLDGTADDLRFYSTPFVWEGTTSGTHTWTAA